MDQSNGTNSTVMGDDGNGTYLSECGWLIDMDTIDTATTPELYVELVCYPILLFLCTVGNCTTLLVMGRDPHKREATIYLMCLAVSDMFVLWLQLPVYIAEYNPSLLEDYPSFYVPFLNFTGLQAAWGETCIQFSDWLLIVFAVERFVAVSYPMRARPQHPVRRTIMIASVVLFLAILEAMGNGVIMYYRHTHDPGANSTKAITLPPALERWKHIQNQSEAGITIGKFLLLAVINFAIFLVLSRHHRALDKLSSSKRSTRSTSDIFLLSCFLLYFFTQFPNLVWKCLQIAAGSPFCTYHLTRSTERTTRPFIQTSLLANYSLNFFVYVFLCEKFRVQLRELCCSRQAGDERRRSTDTILTDIGSLARPNGLMRMSIPDEQILMNRFPDKNSRAADI